MGEEGLQEIDYTKLRAPYGRQPGNVTSFKATSGWLGITDKYWATALVPEQNAAYAANFKAYNAKQPTEQFQTDFLLNPVTVAPRREASRFLHVFRRRQAGQRHRQLQDKYNIKLFDRMIDWGWFYFITKPLFHALDFFYHLVGNFGVAILIVTVLVKLLFFPLANKSYELMSKMKGLQPEMKRIQERYKDDRMKQQQALMELYKKEKVNPMAGCLPILIQIPVFFALYKVLYVTIEMRHAPFFGWIQDLSAPDPDHDLQSVRADPVGAAALPDDRHLAAHHGRHDVPADEAQSRRRRIRCSSRSSPGCRCCSPSCWPRSRPGW